MVRKIFANLANNNTYICLKALVFKKLNSVAMKHYALYLLFFFSLFADQKISAQIKEIKFSADLPVTSFSVTNLAASDSASVGPQPGLLPGTWLQIYAPEKVPFIKP